MANIKSLEKQVGSLSVHDFLKYYCGVSHNNTGKMTHETISMFFPNLRRTSYEYVEKNPGMLCRGEIILVRDSANHLAPYIVPETKLFVEEEQFEIETLVEEIMKSLDVTLQMSESAVIVIEGQDCLDSFIKIDKTSNCPRSLSKALIEAARDTELDGVVISNDGDVSKLSLRNGSLEKLTEETDSIIIVLEDNQSITFIADGISQIDFDLIMLRANLYSHFDMNESIVEEEKEIYPPSSYDLDNMSNFDLSRLMKEYKTAKQFDYYYAVRRVLTKRNRGKKERKRQAVKQMRRKIREEVE